MCTLHSSNVTWSYFGTQYLDIGTSGLPQILTTCTLCPSLRVAKISCNISRLSFSENKVKGI